ncbi:MAG: hypothetical protein JW795_15420 [Chitinivibrionales bacterium]|nr:hypothetical protein [Chitinivibrionales bacterium]
MVLRIRLNQFRNFVRMNRFTAAVILLFSLGLEKLSCAVEPVVGFQNALWGMTPEEVKKISNIQAWQQEAVQEQFAQGTAIELFSVDSKVAGYKAKIRYYFFQQRFFQATVNFDFSHLKTYDFNYNVFISVDKYYRAIHDQTIVFVDDIYALLQKKYGKKQPVFQGLDPRYMFRALNQYVKQEVWNFRYHPYEYYRQITTSAYAQWNFPKTRAIFSLALSAKDKRFDYTLSLTSLDLESQINIYKDSIRLSGL